MKKPTVFLDADVIFAGAASPTDHGASHVVLLLGEITLINCVTSAQVITEVERNLELKLPAKLPELRLLISHCISTVLPDPEPDELKLYEGQADPKDLPILIAALKHNCDYLLTFNVRHYFPTEIGIIVQRPGAFLTTIRSLLSQLSLEAEE